MGSVALLLESLETFRISASPLPTPFWCLWIDLETEKVTVLALRTKDTRFDFHLYECVEVSSQQ